MVNKKSQAQVLDPFSVKIFHGEFSWVDTIISDVGKYVKSF